MLNSARSVIFLSVGIKAVLWRLGHHSNKLQGRSWMANSCACLRCAQSVCLAQGHTESGQDVKYSNTDMQPRGGRSINIYRNIHMRRAALFYIHHVMIFSLISDTSSHMITWAKSVCKTAVLWNSQNLRWKWFAASCAFCVLLSYIKTEFHSEGLVSHFF